jgi:hypothetical protein
MPTGKDNVKNNIVSSPTATPTVTTVDYSIQPGQGAWGMVFQWQAFKNMGKIGVLHRWQLSCHTGRYRISTFWKRESPTRSAR